MKELANTLKMLVLLAILGSIFVCSFLAWRAYEDHRIFAPPPPKTQQEIQLENEIVLRKLEAEKFNVWIWNTSKLLLLYVALPLVGVAFALHFGGAAGIKKLIHVNDRYPDSRGNFPLIKSTYKGHDGTRFDSYHNENLSTSPAKVYSNNGSTTYYSYEDEVSDQQRGYAAGSWGHQSIQAMAATGKISAPAMRAMIGRSPEAIERDRLKAEQERVRLRILENREVNGNSRKVYTNDVPQLPIIPELPLTLQKSLEESIPGNIKIGQASNEARDVYELTFDGNPFWLVAGKTRMGKTTTAAFHMVLACIYWGWPVTVFEPTTKRDWSAVFGSHITHHEVVQENAVIHMRMVQAEYHRRAEIMNQHQIRNWQDAPNLITPWVLVLEEFGALREGFSLMADQKEGKSLGEDFDRLLKILLKEAAASGLIIIFVDQYPQKYDPAVRGAMTKLAFYMGGQGLGNIVDSPKNARINKERGTFDIGDIDANGEPIFYNALRVDQEVGAFLPRIPVPQPLPLLQCPDGCFDVGKPNDYPASPQDVPSVSPGQNGRTQDVPSGDEKYPLPVGETGEIDITGGGDTWSKLVIPPSLIRGYNRTRRWDDFCSGFMVAYEDATAADLKRAMADAANDGRDPKSFNGEGSRQWHRWSKNGNPDKADRSNE